MKTIILFSLALFFTANAAHVPAPVLDFDGQYLHTGAKYYVMPAALDGENGGLLSVKFNRKPCPAGVEQSRSDETGLPVTFTSVNPKKGVIRLSTDVNIKFLETTGWDIESNVWKVKYDKALKQYAVMVGGVEGNPGPETVDNWFKIEKTNNGYKFVFCPSVCSYCKVMCKDVGTVLDKDGWLRLVLSDDPMSFLFWTLDY
uniref:Putative 21 kDa seed protein n=1 Tax=Helianthus annuus TaxID=4232 RepID=A0A251U241_HELAN